MRPKNPLTKDGFSSCRWWHSWTSQAVEGPQRSNRKRGTRVCRKCMKFEIGVGPSVTEYEYVDVKNVQDMYYKGMLTDPWAIAAVETLQENAIAVEDGRLSLVVNNRPDPPKNMGQGS